jgi:hypothetical protein
MGRDKLGEYRLRVIRVAEWIAYCERERMAHESIPEVSERLIITTTLEELGVQKRAADLLYMTARVLNYRLRSYRMRRKDAGGRRLHIVGGCDTPRSDARESDRRRVAKEKKP